MPNILIPFTWNIRYRNSFRILISWCINFLVSSVRNFFLFPNELTKMTVEKLFCIRRILRLLNVNKLGNMTTQFSFELLIIWAQVKYLLPEEHIFLSSTHARKILQCIHYKFKKVNVHYFSSTEVSLILKWWFWMKSKW